MALLRPTRERRRTTHARSRARTGAAALTLAFGVAPWLAGCGAGGGNDYTAYCGAVSSGQQQLTQALSGSGAGALVAALPAFETLRDKAPTDIRGSWDQLVTAVTGMQQALEAAGIDPATYDASKLPSGLTAAQRAALSAAGSTLESPSTLQASLAVQQEVRDVCHTPLSL